MTRKNTRKTAAFFQYFLKYNLRQSQLFIEGFLTQNSAQN